MQLVKYLYKDKRPVGEIWTGKKKLDTGTVVIIGGVTALAFIAAGYAWWKMSPAARLKPAARSTCHTCGGK